jgi:hypothetical protein
LPRSLCLGLPAIAYLASLQRERVVAKYNIREPYVCCLGATVLAGFYACSLFQTHVFLQVRAPGGGKVLLLLLLLLPAACPASLPKLLQQSCAGIPERAALLLLPGRPRRPSSLPRRPVQEATDFMHQPPTAHELGEAARQKEEDLMELGRPTASNGPSGWTGSQASTARGGQQPLPQPSLGCRACALRLGRTAAGGQCRRWR